MIQNETKNRRGARTVQYGVVQNIFLTVFQILWLQKVLAA